VLAFGSALTLPLVLVMTLALARRIASEERLLEERFGVDFSGYRSRVGGILPRFGGARAPRGGA
jgi:protein-S-isoprenylcysteine O-methyltransferase Ste14